VSAVVARLAESAERSVEPGGPVAEGGPVLISSSSEVHGSITSDTIVQRNCTLHVRGNLLGGLTIEPGASVVVDGSIDGRIINKGGRLQVYNKGLAACVTVEGPSETEAGGTLKINLTNLAANYERLTKRTEAECAAVVRADAYAAALARSPGRSPNPAATPSSFPIFRKPKAYARLRLRRRSMCSTAFIPAPHRPSPTSMRGR
jgi:hypothetical protein